MMTIIFETIHVVVWSMMTSSMINNQSRRYLTKRRRWVFCFWINWFDKFAKQTFKKKNYLWSEVVNKDIYVMITWMLMCAELIQRSNTFNISTYNVQKRIFIIINAHDEKRIQNLEIMKWFIFFLTFYQLRRRDLSYTSVQITVNIRDLSSWAASTASTRLELYECTNYD
jgi:hypothetical protein